MSLLSSSHLVAVLIILILLLSSITLEWPALVTHWGEVQGSVVDKNPAWAPNHTLLARRLGLGP